MPHILLQLPPAHSVGRPATPLQPGGALLGDGDTSWGVLPSPEVCRLRARYRTPSTTAWSNMPGCPDPMEGAAVLASLPLLPGCASSAMMLLRAPSTPAADAAWVRVTTIQHGNDSSRSYARPAAATAARMRPTLAELPTDALQAAVPPSAPRKASGLQLLRFKRARMRCCGAPGPASRGGPRC